MCAACVVGSELLQVRTLKGDGAPFDVELAELARLKLQLPLSSSWLQMLLPCEAESQAATSLCTAAAIPMCTIVCPHVYCAKPHIYCGTPDFHCVASHKHCSALVVDVAGV